MKEKTEFIPALYTCLDILLAVIKEDSLNGEKKQLIEIREKLGLMVITRRKLRKKWKTNFEKGEMK
jgi:hypothetical protein